MKIRIIYKYKGGQTLSAIACEHDFSASTINTIMKDAARMKEYVKGATLIKLIIHKREGAMSEMEKLIQMWMEEAQIQKRIPLSLMTI
jgi:hypothetical protein